MFIDAPSYDTGDNDNDENEVIDLREETAEDFEAKLKNIFG